MVSGMKQSHLVEVKIDNKYLPYLCLVRGWDSHKLVHRIKILGE